MAKGNAKRRTGRTTSGSRTSARKTEHLQTCLESDVEFQQKTTWLEHVELVHEAIPGAAPDAVDTSVTFMGRDLAAPFVIGAMTGGTAQARRINRKLASVAQAAGIGLALGSQRPMVEDPSLADTYAVRDIAPDVLLLGNIGIVQAARMPAAEVIDLMSSIGADGMCVHLNSAMEMFQGEGEAPPTDPSATIGRLAKELGERLIVKETGCGMSRDSAVRLTKLGVRVLDVAGAGGTSWVRVENLRAGRQGGRAAAFEEWGIPTAASLCEVNGLPICVTASGGIRSGLDLAKALALGADLGSAALPILRALSTSGVKGARRWVESLLTELRTTIALVGGSDLAALRKAGTVVTGPLRDWVYEREISV